MSFKGQIISPSRIRKLCLLLILLLFLANTGFGQKDTVGFWDVPTSFHPKRYYTVAITGVTAYTIAFISLNELWYEDYPRTSFHFFNDAAEWQQMDKAGHMFAGYFQTDWIHGVLRWTGVKRNSAIWASALASIGLQTSVEVLDGFSSKWGFSVSDFAFNVFGASAWAGQQFAWDEQRIRLKVSTTYRIYPEDVVYGVPGGMTTIRERTNDLYGENILETFLKDYNAQTIWASANIHSFLPEESKFPKWLNIAVGYGAENMYGGFENEWMIDENTFTLSDAEYPRYRQILISPDIDLSKIPIKSKPLKTLVSMINIFKIPAPAVIFNGKGPVQWKWIYY